MKLRHVLFGLFGLAPVAANSLPEGFIYDGEGKSASSSIVINMETRSISYQDAASANINDSSSEFSGSANNCSTATFFCIGGSINFVIPKDISSSYWSYDDVRCSLIYHDKNGAYKIKCHYRGEEPLMVFYSRDRGIIGFQQHRKDHVVSFRIRGSRGLFARPGR
ncbi:hypothetical protein [Dyella sp. 20L07]|uniref:hypothetical protein n=1 Tax=Dyella sp. 20L07 TaxID=3384240 RepID=UPI003D27E3C7